MPPLVVLKLPRLIFPFLLLFLYFRSFSLRDILDAMLLCRQEYLTPSSWPPPLKFPILTDTRLFPQRYFTRLLLPGRLFLGGPPIHCCSFLFFQNFANASPKFSAVGALEMETGSFTVRWFQLAIICLSSIFFKFVIFPPKCTLVHPLSPPLHDPPEPTTTLIQQSYFFFPFNDDAEL